VAGIQKWTGREVRALREALRMSSRDFAGRLGLSDRAVSKWESPTKPTVPRADSQAMLDTMLANASGDERARFDEFLADYSAEATEAISQPPVEQIEISPSPAVANGYMPSGWAHADTLDVDDVERRELLKIIGGITLVGSGVDADRLRRKLDSALNAPTTMSDLAEWERVASQYSMESGLVAPALLLPELLSDLDEAQQRLSGSPESLRAPMARVCGYLSALAAGNFFNAGDEKNARRYWRTALRLIGQSGDRSAQAELYADRASWVLLESRPSPSFALSLADDAIGISGDIPCAGTVNGYAARAMALALLGNHRESARAVRDLTDTFTRLPGTQAIAHSSWGYSQQQLHFVEGHVYAHAGRVRDAGKALDSGLSLVPAGQWIAVTSFEVNRAISLIRGGDPSEGARHIVRAVRALPQGYRQSATVRRASFALDAVPANAVNTPAVAEARELLSLPQGA
jgi:transcriptional regulator with XRE-family HTH domain